MTLSHRMLGQLVGARRPTVTTALAQLAKDGELARRDDGTWLLTAASGEQPHRPLDGLRDHAATPADPAEP